MQILENTKRLGVLSVEMFFYIELVLILVGYMVFIVINVILILR